MKISKKIIGLTRSLLLVSGAASADGNSLLAECQRLMRCTVIFLVSVLALTACSDDNLTPEHLMGSAGYGLLQVNTNEGVFNGTQIKFNDFVGAECASIVSELKKSKTTGVWTFMLEEFTSGSGETLHDARTNVIVRDDCVPRSVDFMGSLASATKACKGHEGAFVNAILSRTDNGLATELRLKTGATVSLGYENLDAGFVSKRLFYTKKQIDEWGTAEFQDSEYLVCVISE